ncbi:hypothetical protein EP47_11450 [Legionella norrlandica]|uniref:Uncharacterized protein n=2 Tax=Legionella norrlandica TaxID=1498499 RepID=A0A0A2SYB6_9GAMM|nr:hypothetical protein EP47_11450 [Legionella norrlandica]
MPDIIILTHAPQKTLGDPSAAAKLQQILMEKFAGYYRNLVIKVVVNVKKSDEEPVRNLFAQGMSYELINGIDTSEGMTRLKEIISEAELIISYPTPHFIVENVAELLSDSMKPVISIAEYDYDMRFQLSQRKYIPIIPGTFFLSTGIGEGNLGIYIEKFSEPAKIHPEDYAKLPGDLLSESKELYFGYFNKLFKSYTGATPIKYIAFAINSSSKREIDIILPLQPRDTPEGNSESKANILLSDEFIKDLETFNHILISYLPTGPHSPLYLMYQRKGDNLAVSEISQEDFENQKDKSDKLIRIINPFPLHKDSMRALVEASEPVNLLTGDQSFSEALSLSKIAFYQTMPWKRKFYDALRAASQKYKTLEEWFEIAGKKGVPVQALVEFYKKNKDNLLAEVQALQKDFEKSKNLSVLFPNFLDNFLQSNPLERFTQFIDHLKHNMEYYANVEKPDEQRYVLTQKSLGDHLFFYLNQAKTIEKKNKMLAYFDSHIDSLIKMNPIKKVWFYFNLKTQHPELPISLPASYIIEYLHNLALSEEDIYDIYGTPILKNQTANTYAKATEQEEQLQETMLSLYSCLRILEITDIAQFTPEEKLNALSEIMRCGAICRQSGDELDKYWLEFLEHEMDKRVWQQMLKLLFTTPCYKSLDEGAAFDPDKPSLFFKLSKHRPKLVEMLLHHPDAIRMLTKELFFTDHPTVKAYHTKINELVLNSLFSIRFPSIPSYRFFRDFPKVTPKEKELIGKILSVEGEEQAVIISFLKEKLATNPKEIAQFTKDFTEYLPGYLREFFISEQVAPPSSCS